MPTCLIVSSKPQLRHTTNLGQRNMPDHVDIDDVKYNEIVLKAHFEISELLDSVAQYCIPSAEFNYIKQCLSSRTPREIQMQAKNTQKSSGVSPWW